MQRTPSLFADAAALRRDAEMRLRAQHPKVGPDRTAVDTQRLLHELQVHQIELEMQNEELVKARAALESERELYSDLFDFAPVSYMTLDSAGAIQTANLAAAGLLGIELSRLVKRRLDAFVVPGDQAAFTGFLKRVFERKAQEACDLALRREGQPPIEVRIAGAVAASGQECRLVVQDITERKRAEADRLILSKLEATGVLAGGIAHDFNNLLTVILMNLELSRMLVPSGEESARRLEAATKAALKAGDLTQQFITFAHGGAPIRKPTALTEVIQESARVALGVSQVTCGFVLAPDLWPAEVDAGQIGQVIQNVVQNAWEAMSGEGAITIRAENLVRSGKEHPSMPPGRYVRVSIADQGSGIAKDVFPRIFDPYFSTKQRGEQKGMGLGLTVCHSIIQKHGGAIDVESKVGIGTTLHLYLPAVGKLSAPKKALGTEARARTGRILVMEDEKSVREVVRAILQRLGYDVDVVEDGQKAIEVFRLAKELGRPFDAVILDSIVHAGMGGQEAIGALRGIDPAVKAIAMSGYANNPVILDHERYGFEGALTKPFHAGQIQAILARILQDSPRGQTPS